MEAAATLSTLASVAVSLIGFSGLVAAFRAANDQLQPNDVVNIRILLIFSVSALLLALLPLPFLDGSDPGSFWAFATLFLGLFLLFWCYRSPVWMRRKNLSPRRPRLFYGMLVAQGLIGAILIAAGLLLPAPAPFYILGVLWCLLVAIVVFVVQIFSLLRIEQP